MSEVILVVTNDRQLKNARYVQHHIEQFLYSFNGLSIQVENGDAPEMILPQKYQNEPSMMIVYNFVFRDPDA